MLYDIFSIICIVLLALIALGYSIVIFTKERSKRIEHIRNFKKGNFAIIYIVAIPIYWLGHIYDGQDVFLSFFNAIEETKGLVVLDYEISSVADLVANNRIYSFAVHFCFLLVTINATLFALSFLYQKIGECIQRAKWNLSKKEKLLIVGNNENNLKIYFSEKNRAALILDDISKEDKTKLYLKKVAFASKSNDACVIRNKNNALDFNNGIEEYCCKMLVECLSTPQKSCVIVVNTQNDDRNIAMCHKIVACTDAFFKGKDASVIANNLKRVRVYVFGMPDYEAIYNSIVESSNGCIRYINKYRQIAIDFIDRYPLTQFMTGEQIDYKTSLLRKNVDINVAMIGFGKTNRQILLSSVANNQFLSEDNGKKHLEKVQYHIFDKQYIDNNKNLNHSYYRFKNEFANEIKAQEKGCENITYLPMPSLPAEEFFDKLDINDADFYKKIRSALQGEGKFNYIIIAFGTDLENIDMAQKIVEKKQEWGLNNTFVFVKVRSGDEKYEIFNREDCFIIAEEQEVVYNINRIDDDSITAMAKMRNRIYSLEYEMASRPNKMPVIPVDKVYAQADCDWYIKKTQFERESNVYACLSLRSKLHLMGLDYVPADNENQVIQIDKEEYLNCYAGEDKPIYYNGILANGKEVVKYDLDFKDSRRTTMAIHEHFRWNSFMISKGFVPASKDEILNDRENNGKNYLLRRHGNLTTFEGLEEFRKLIAERDGLDEIATDVIKYDYQLLDDAYWILNKNNYRIIGRTK